MNTTAKPEPRGWELTSLQVIETLEQILGTTADPSLHPGAEIEIRSDTNVAVLALGRNYRIDETRVWLRPLANPPGSDDNYFTADGNQAMCLGATGQVQLNSPARLVLREAGYEHNSGPTIEIRPATGTRRHDLSNWDLFTLTASAGDRQRLAACTPELEPWPTNPFTNTNTNTRL